jgi:hypothetical protein
VLERVVDLV